MNKLDPQLAFLTDGGVDALRSTHNEAESLKRFGVQVAGAESEPPAATDVRVLVRYVGDPVALEQAGLAVQTIAGDVVTGTIALDDVKTLASLPDVEVVEAARSMQVELDLALVESRADLVHVGPPGRRGSGVVVGICDSGCDFTHPSFRRTDGTSRILFLWDQSLTPLATEGSPAGFGFGVEYTNVQINAALASATPFASVRHRDPGGHGTHVTGIAAGDGSAPGQGRPGGTFVGVAPEADIIVVANASNGAEGLGTSASTLDAVNYIFQRAESLAKPCVINMSLGDNLGPHDGTSLLERGLNNLLGGAGRAFVKSAGNAGNQGIHASGAVASGATVDVQFNQPAGDTTANQIDVWYRGGDTFRVAVVDPLGNVAGPVNVGAVATTVLPGGNRVRIDHRNNDPFNGDRRAFLTFTPGAPGTMRAGNWSVRLIGVASPLGGAFDAWIQRGQVVPRFLAPHESSARTISTPGTAAEVITAGNYITRGAGVGSLASSSSRGPTRDGRAAPTLAAPGSLIMSADGENSSGDPYRLDGGTSMAAPHVVGTIALMLQKNRNRTQAQIKACLESSARSDVQTGAVPNTAWGAGKLDAKAAVDCVPATFVISVVAATCQPLSRVAACQPISRVATCQPLSRVIACQPVSRVLCPSVAGATCGITSVACPSRICPSVVDGCPSTPGGCGINSVVCGGPITPFGGAAPEALPAGWAQPHPQTDAYTFYEYDESWFDGEGQS